MTKMTRSIITEKIEKLASDMKIEALMLEENSLKDLSKQENIDYFVSLTASTIRKCSALQEDIVTFLYESRKKQEPFAYEWCSKLETEAKTTNDFYIRIAEEIEKRVPENTFLSSREICSKIGLNPDETQYIIIEIDSNFSQITNEKAIGKILRWVEEETNVEVAIKNKKYSYIFRG